MSLTPEQAALRDRALAKETCEGWALHMGWTLRREGRELVGGCPVCGDDGKRNANRFSINPQKNIWNCRICDVGGDVIKLVQHTEKLGFLEACRRITGETAAMPLTEEERQRLERERERKREEQQRTAAEFREKARREARTIWKAAHRVVGVEPERLGIAGYLRTRGIGGGAIDFGNPEWAMELNLPVRYQEGRSYWHDRRVLHVGPAMIAAIQLPDGRFAGVHQTWLDPEQPKGKVKLTDTDGAELPAKKVLGVKKGCAIRLYTPDGARRLVMGEGIETTMTALAHAREPETAYWAGVDLGNMSGRAARDAANKQVHAQPDMDDRDCFLPPDWVEELVYLCDGDEPEKHTEDKVRRGLRRARRLREVARLARPDLPSLRIKMVPPGAAGTDLNSLAMAELEDGRGEA